MSALSGCVVAANTSRPPDAMPQLRPGKVYRFIRHDAEPIELRVTHASRDSLVGTLVDHPDSTRVLARSEISKIDPPMARMSASSLGWSFMAMLAVAVAAIYLAGPALVLGGS